MSRWFRFYDEVLNDPKVMTLEPVLFKFWVKVLCVASNNKGTIIKRALPFYLRESPEQVETLLKQLIDAGLVDETIDGLLEPHNWGKRQFVSDGSAERVKRHRAKRAAAGLKEQWCAPKKLRDAVYERDGHQCIYCGASERLSLDHRTPEIRGGTHDIENLATACLSCNGAKRDMTEEEYRTSVTLLKRPQNTEQNITEEKKIRRKAPRRISYPPRFQVFWEGYPTDPLMSKSEAFTEWQKLSPEDQEAAIATLPAFKAATAKLGSDHRVIHACRFLSKRRWEGFTEQAAKLKAVSETASAKVYVKYGTEPGDAWEQAFRLNGKIPPRDNGGGWWFDSEYPPENVKRETSQAA